MLRSHSRIVAIPLCLLVSIAWFVLRATCAETIDEGNVHFQAKAPIITLHEPVIISMEIRNTESKPIHFDLGRDRKQNFLFVVTTPDGRRIRLPELKKSGFSRSGSIDLVAGGSYEQQLILNEWFSFDEVGHYVIEASVTIPENEAKANPLNRLQVSKFNIQILPLDDRQLFKTCAGLAEEVEMSNSYAVAAQAATALSYVSDTVAVPYLRRILTSQKLVEPIAIQGLERIGTREAVEAMSLGLQIDSNNTAILSQAALRRVGAKSQDPSVRHFVQITLHEQ